MSRHLTLTASVIILAACVGSARAVTSSDFTYSAPKQGRFSIAPGAMVPRSDRLIYTLSSTSLTSGDEGSANCFSTGVNLPQGAVIQNVTTWFRSNAASDIGVYLYRHNLSTDVAQLLTPGYIADNSNTRKSRTNAPSTSFRVVDNSTFDYSYWICLGSGTDFYGARINYTYTNAGD